VSGIGSLRVPSPLTGPPIRRPPMVPSRLRLINYYQLPMSHHEPSVTDVPPYEVLCLERDPSAGDDHDHVVVIETRDPDGGRTRWAVVEVIAAVREGERFTLGEGAGSLEPGICPACASVTLVAVGGVEIPACR